MNPIDARSVPLDAETAATLTAQGLDYTRVEPTGEEFAPFLEAVDRGFLSDEPTDEQMAFSRESIGYRRLTGVYDPRAARPDVPVGTVDSWITDLTTDPGATIPMWAISAVTVAATHRRRGIARAMLTGELRAAAEAGVAVAGLTVSEATIYGRWGFSPAVYTTDWTIDTARARWIGPRPDGRLDFVARDALPAVLAEVHERVRLQRAGEVEGWPGLWRRMAGQRPGSDDGRKVRAVRYRDAEAVTRGVLVYTLVPHDDDYSKHELRITALFTDGDDAYAALWAFALEHDLVATVTASLRSGDEPLRWMLADQRAASVRATDHGWLRVLDVPAVLRSRTYRRSVDVTVRVTDPLGFADGTWRMRVERAGAASVEISDMKPEVTLTVGALSSIVLGGVRPSVLRAAGLIAAAESIAADLDEVFAARRAPTLSLWY